MTSIIPLTSFDNAIVIPPTCLCILVDNTQELCVFSVRHTSLSILERPHAIVTYNMPPTRFVAALITFAEITFSSCGHLQEDDDVKKCPETS